MPLVLPDRWLWDFWFARDGPDYHMFYLQAPKSLEKEELRHWNATVGHAVSADLESWELLPDALKPSGDDQAFDNKTTWTGSIIHHGGTWFMFYTGTSKVESGLVQRIGLATSDDLIAWEKHPGNPVIEVDPHWYELLDLDVWHDQAWRDPWVFCHPATGQFHALITARVNFGPADGRGVIAQALSEDLIHWQVLPPLIRPGRFGHLEVPQLVEMEGKHYLFFSTPDDKYAREYARQSGVQPTHGSHYLISEDPLGPFEYPCEEFLLGDQIGSLYGAKAIQDPEGQWSLMAFRNYAPDGSFIGELNDPIPLEVDNTGKLSVKGRSF